MIKVTLEIDNRAAHSCSPVEFLRKYILQGAFNIVHGTTKEVVGYETPHARIHIKKIKQD